MFKKDKDDAEEVEPVKEKEQTPTEATSKLKHEQTAYEDSWYRSLKAMSEQRPEDSDDEQVGAPED